MGSMEQLPVTLIDLLANTVILRQTAPYIPVKSLLQLTATSKEIRGLLYSQPEPWRYMDLTNVRHANIDSSPIDVGGMTWRAERMDESLTEDDFYAGPLRGIFANLHRHHILKNVQTLILDGLSVPADLVREIVAEDRFNVKVLSLREAKHLNPWKLQQVLRYIVRPTRATGTPKLRALYLFGPKNAPRTAISPLQGTLQGPEGVMRSQGAQIGAETGQRSGSSPIRDSRWSSEQRQWYCSSGRAIRSPMSDWPETLRACKDLIMFDAVLCRGPLHDITKVDSKDFIQPRIATIALGPHGCESCKSCPEGRARYGETPDSTVPLLGPVPSHSSLLKSALRPDQDDGAGYPELIARCEDCVRARWCEQCNRWWCEDCYQQPISRIHRTEMQQLELREELQREGWATVHSHAGDTTVKVFSKLCVEHCLVGEMMSGAGSAGMWG